MKFSYFLFYTYIELKLQYCTNIVTLLMHYVNNELPAIITDFNRCSNNNIIVMTFNACDVTVDVCT